MASELKSISVISGEGWVEVSFLEGGYAKVSLVPSGGRRTKAVTLAPDDVKILGMHLIAHAIHGEENS